eukprot:scaffold3341_cov153-Isochrysis_galbana.AAC.5
MPRCTVCTARIVATPSHPSHASAMLQLRRVASGALELRRVASGARRAPPRCSAASRAPPRAGTPTGCARSVE